MRIRGRRPHGQSLYSLMYPDPSAPRASPAIELHAGGGDKRGEQHQNNAATDLSDEDPARRVALLPEGYEEDCELCRMYLLDARRGPAAADVDGRTMRLGNDYQHNKPDDVEPVIKAGEPVIKPPDVEPVIKPEEPVIKPPEVEPVIKAAGETSSVVSSATSPVTAAAKEDGASSGAGDMISKKRRRNTAAPPEGSRCSRANGRGWRCIQPTLVGYSLCEYHLGKGRRVATGQKLGRTEHQKN